MPKIPTYTLAWSPVSATYELYKTSDGETLPIIPESSDWFAWLESASSFAFIGKHVHYTARKETRARGEYYWYAYFTRNRRLSKKYLGKTARITLSHLESIAEVLSTRHNDEFNGPPAQVVEAETNEEETPLQPVPASSPRSPLHPLLMTKFHIPRPGTQLVARTRLLERLQQSTQRPLTLISAPAGFGKTTLLTQWHQQSSLPVAWLSLEPEDNDPARLLPYLLVALQTLDARLGATALALLHTPQPPRPEAVLTLLVNDMLTYRDKEMVLVLDDYHVITNESLQRAMVFLLEHLPPQLHLILATRTDPPLPLARLRARGDLLEIRASDLRFAHTEASAFLQTVMGLELPPGTLAMLERQTEGWIAGLQLAALSLQGRKDVTQFLTSFTGTHHFVLDYLSEEVLTQQPPAVQTFLLYTSLLGRLSGSLCDAVTGRKDSQNMLEMLEKANLFVIALDEARNWYRYHHLFAETLGSHLQQREPEMIPQLHRRASDWYEQHELPLEAVRHALAIPDEERVIRLLEPIVIPFAFRGQRSIVLNWLNALPKAVMQAHPLLCVYYGSLLLLTNQFEAALIRLQEAEAGIGEKTPPGHRQIIRGYVLTCRSTIAFFSGDIPNAISFARQALDTLPEDDEYARVGVLANTTHAYLSHGNVTLASEQAIAETVALIRASSNPFAAVSALALQAQVQVMQGRLKQAAATYERMAEDIASPEALQTTFSGPYYYFGLGDLEYEWNILEAAETSLRKGTALIHAEVPLEARVAIQGYTALARLWQARGDPLKARATLDELSQIARQRHFAAPLLALIAARRVQLELKQGNLAAARRWAETSKLSLNDTDLLYSRESEYLILARISIAQRMQAQTMFPFREILLLLGRLLREAECQERLGSVLEILIVRTLALEAGKKREAALTTLGQALLLAEPEGYIRLFVEEGPLIQAVLRRVAPDSIVSAYATTLLQAFALEPAAQLSLPMPWASVGETLTTREQEVLELLLKGASNREIAHQLVLSINTVKRHVYNLCGKLEVRSRAQIIARARSLNHI